MMWHAHFSFHHSNREFPKRMSRRCIAICGVALPFWVSEVLGLGHKLHPKRPYIKHSSKRQILFNHLCLDWVEGGFSGNFSVQLSGPRPFCFGHMSSLWPCLRRGASAGAVAWGQAERGEPEDPPPQWDRPSGPSGTPVCERCYYLMWWPPIRDTAPRLTGNPALPWELCEANFCLSS